MAMTVRSTGSRGRAGRGLSSSLSRFGEHPIALTRASGDWAGYRLAASAASAIEAELNHVRRVAGREPPQVFGRTVELALRELRVTCAKYPGRGVDRWRREVTREMGALLFEHVADAEVEITIGRDLRLAQRDSDA